ncbi:MAG TPA: enolase C-terminal domain-like protein [Mycobacterium sp.]|nr:enolase C-terminal domain-like protein [Mycobacterium sp.]
MKITRLDTAVYRFPTPEPEADGTLEWNATTAVAVTAHAGDMAGLGWTYSTGAAAAVVREHLVDAVLGQDCADVAACWDAMHRACRNLGTRGLVMQALSAVDIALWDLKARAIGVSLRELFGAVRREVPVYGSGGFTTMSDAELDEQVAQWKALGCHAMKIKIGESWGRRADRDLSRVAHLRELAPDADLMVDANGGYSRAQARRVGAALDDLGVVWFEEPVSSDDLDGLAVVRDCVQGDVTAGEYASDVYDAARLCRVVDCLQLDATRCGGYTGFARAADVAAAHNLEVSAHCAPALHAPIAAATANLRHVEYFADHARLEPLLVEHAPVVREGVMRANDTAGHGLVLHTDAERWRT